MLGDLRASLVDWVNWTPDQAETVGLLLEGALSLGTSA